MGAFEDRGFNDWVVCKISVFFGWNANPNDNNPKKGHGYTTPFFLCFSLKSPQIQRQSYHVFKFLMAPEDVLFSSWHFLKRKRCRQKFGAPRTKRNASMKSYINNLCTLCYCWAYIRNILLGHFSRQGVGESWQRTITERTGGFPWFGSTFSWVEDVARKP